MGGFSPKAGSSIKRIHGFDIERGDALCSLAFALEDAVSGGIYSPHVIRVSQDAVGKLAEHVEVRNLGGMLVLTVHGVPVQISGALPSMTGEIHAR